MADAVLIEITPDAQVNKSIICSVHLAVTVFIKFFQRLIAVGGALAVFEQGVVAEKLAAVIDDSVAIAVINEETVVLAYPTGGGANAVFVVVKEGTFVTITGNCFNTIAIKIESKRVINNITVFAG